MLLHMYCINKHIKCITHINGWYIISINSYQKKPFDIYIIYIIYNIIYIIIYNIILF